MSENIIELNETNFETEVKNTKQTVLVDFWAAWCAPCAAVAPVLEKMAEEFRGRLKVFKLNIDDNQKLASEFGVMSIPTLIIFKEGKELDRIIGVAGEAQLLKKIREKIG